MCSFLDEENLLPIECQLLFQMCLVFNFLCLFVPGTTACAEKCEAESQCQAYSYSPNLEQCFLSKVQIPTGNSQYKDFNFCSKSPVHWYENHKVFSADQCPKEVLHKNTGKVGS